MKKLNFTCSILAFFSVVLFSEAEAKPLMKEIPAGIISAFKSGNAKELAVYFNSNIEMSVLDDENIYSRAHAEQLIKEFFAKYPPRNFIILHEGGKEGSKYAIGNLITTNGIFRVYFLLKEREGNPLIHQLRIEPEEK
ncbi:MAG: DUF4783 domain-containing protein [Bacteroidota bacterium]|nr:DUF4783 domain-containing protein [Bacteroidota bacterium]MDP4226913.1 DUF4783 domain-containing protein [Bacteroidota bacterium]MDP4275402.1 DUF4783 domain-containing protein [Bacteroidota bacterium]